MSLTNNRGLPQVPQYVSSVNRTNSLLRQVRIMHSLKSMQGSVLVGHSLLFSFFGIDELFTLFAFFHSGFNQGG